MSECVPQTVRLGDFCVSHTYGIYMHRALPCAWGEKRNREVEKDFIEVATWIQKGRRESGLS